MDAQVWSQVDEGDWALEALAGTAMFGSNEVQCQKDPKGHEGANGGLC